MSVGVTTARVALLAVVAIAPGCKGKRSDGDKAKATAPAIDAAIAAKPAALSGSIMLFVDDTLKRAVPLAELQAWPTVASLVADVPYSSWEALHVQGQGKVTFVITKPATKLTKRTPRLYIDDKQLPSIGLYAKLAADAPKQLRDAVRKAPAHGLHGIRRITVHTKPLPIAKKPPPARLYIAIDGKRQEIPTAKLNRLRTRRKARSGGRTRGWAVADVVGLYTDVRRVKAITLLAANGAKQALTLAQLRNDTRPWLIKRNRRGSFQLRPWPAEGKKRANTQLRGIRTIQIRTR